MYLTGSDYNETSPMQVNFTSNQIKVAVDVRIFDDKILEGYEKFSVSIHNFTMPCGIVIPGENKTAEVIVLDNESKHTLITIVNFSLHTYNKDQSYVQYV